METWCPLEDLALRIVMMEERNSENEMRQHNQDRVTLLPWPPTGNGLVL